MNNGRKASQRLAGDAVSGRFSYVDLLPTWMVDTGASGSGAGDGSGTTDDTGSAGQGDDGKDKTGDSGASGSTGTKEVYSAEEVAEIRRRMEAADRTAAENARKLKEFEDKGKTELERAQSEAAEKDQVIVDLSKQLRDQAVQLAAMTGASHITWHDPADALAFIMKDPDVAALEIKDGQVNSAVVKSAADRVAKAKPYLVKTAEDKTDDGKGKGKDDQPSGSGMNGDRKDGDGQADADKMRAKYPALRR
jgi:hypothetical protein